MLVNILLQHFQRQGNKHDIQFWQALYYCSVLTGSIVFALYHGYLFLIETVASLQNENKQQFSQTKYRPCRQNIVWKTENKWPRPTNNFAQYNSLKYGNIYSKNNFHLKAELGQIEISW